MRHRHRIAHFRPRRPRSAAPVLYGFDAEFGNALLGSDSPCCTGGEAAKALLAEIAGHSGLAGGGEHGPFWQKGESDLSTAKRTEKAQTRKYLTNGNCTYIDMDHLEMCLAERLDCFEFPAAVHAALLQVEQARQAANAKLPAGREIIVLANNSDGYGNSYGSHMNFLLPRRPRSLWDDIFHLKSLHLPYLASIQAAMIVLTGLGKVGAENGRPHVDYQIAQRSDFFTRLCSLETTHSRGLVNSRREPLCGPESGDYGPGPYDRLHVIFFDWNLMPVAAILKCGLMQLILASMQRGLVSTRLILDSPVEAAVRFSHDPNLGARCETITGQKTTAVELLCMLAEELGPRVRAGEFDELAPQATRLFALLEDTLAKLQARNYLALASRLDWVLKWTLLQQEINRDPRLNWGSPEIKHLDQVYSSTAADGLFHACAQAGLVEQMPSQSALHRCLNHPPDDTRAWTRGHLLRAAGRWVVHVDWDSVTLQAWEDRATCRYWLVDLADPTAFTRLEAEPIFRRAADLNALIRGLNRLHAPPENPATYDGDSRAKPDYELKDVADRSGPVEAGRQAEADPCLTSSQTRGDVHA